MYVVIEMEISVLRSLDSKSGVRENCLSVCACVLVVSTQR